MLQMIISVLKKHTHKNKMHKQFQDIQKWQCEMYNQKSREELDIH